MTARARKTAAVASAVGVALTAAGCGSSHAADRSAIVKVVNEFATAHSRAACDLLTGKALAEVYGSGDATAGLRACRAAAKTFKGGPVDIIQVKFSTTGLGPTVIARNHQTSRHYTAIMAKVGGRWRIDHITSP